VVYNVGPARDCTTIHEKSHSKTGRSDMEKILAKAATKAFYQWETQRNIYTFEEIPSAEHMRPKRLA